MCDVMWGDPPILVCLELFCVKPKVLHRRTPGWSVTLGAPPSPQGKDKVEPSKFPLMRKVQSPMQGGTQGELCLYFSFSPVLGIEAGMMSGTPAACRWDTSGVTRTVLLTLSVNYAAAASALLFSASLLLSASRSFPTSSGQAISRC